MLGYFINKEGPKNKIMLTLTKYQESYFKNKSNKKLMIWPRRAGATTCMAMDIAYKMAMNNNYVCYYCSITEDTLRLVKRKVEEFVPANTIVKNIFNIIKLSNGSECRFLVPDKSGARTCGIIFDAMYIDSAGHISDEVLDTIMPYLYTQPNVFSAISTGEKLNETIFRLWMNGDWSLV